MHLGQLTRCNRETFGPYTSLIFEHQEYTNEFHDDESSRWARALSEMGVHPGDRVGVMMPNRPEVFWSYSAIVKLGAIVVPIIPLLQVDEVRFIMLDAKPKAVITADLLMAKLEQATKDMEHAPLLLSVDASSENSIREMSVGQSSHPMQVDTTDDNVCVILYTSGTTGRPKGVQLTHRNLFANAKAAADVAQTYPFHSAERVGLFVLPLSHAFGFTMMNTSLILGQRDILLPYFDPVKVFEAIETHGVTHFSAVPAMLHALLTHPAASQYNLSSLALCISGSAPMPKQDIFAFEQRFRARIYQGYGLSEAAPIVTAPRFDSPYKPASVGLPLPGVTVKVVDEKGCELPVGEVGELVVHGPNITQGYHNLPDQTAEVLRDGWLYTGDMARIDEDGYVYIVDRKKDVIIRGGFNIYPRDLEDLLMQHPAVAETAVVGVPSESMGEEVVAYVVRRPNTDISAAMLINYCQEHIARYKTPRDIRFVSYLPKNLLGKVDKKALRSMASADEVAP